jgi:protein TonB
VVALESPPPPPRQKPRPSHARDSPPASPAPPAAETPTDAPVRIAAAPAATPTPGTPGAGSGPGGAGGLGTGVAGTGLGAIGDGPRDGPGDDYLDRLKRWLNKYKHYPKDALEKKQEGRLVVSFVILRDGTVLDPRIERSSGVPSLDAAAIEMLHAASPVPSLPETHRGERASLDLPVGYSIGVLDKLF